MVTRRNKWGIQEYVGKVDVTDEQAEALRRPPIRLREVTGDQRVQDALERIVDDQIRGPDREHG